MDGGVRQEEMAEQLKREVKGVIAAVESARLMRLRVTELQNPKLWISAVTGRSRVPNPSHHPLAGPNVGPTAR